MKISKIFVHFPTYLEISKSFGKFSLKQKEFSSQPFTMETTRKIILGKLYDDPLRRETYITPLITDKENEAPTRWIKNFLLQEKEFRKSKEVLHENQKGTYRKNPNILDLI